MLRVFMVLFLAVVGTIPTHGASHNSDEDHDEMHEAQKPGKRDYCCSVNDDCFPSQSNLSAFEKTLDGSLIFPYMPEYMQQAWMYNILEQRYPAFVVMVKSKEDIQLAVLFARKYNLRVTIRSSGHDYSGRSTRDGSMNINLSQMKDYEVNLDSSRHASGELKVQTGLQWIEIYTLLDEHNRTIVGGSGKTVTSGGYTLGGGHSPISRSFGYAVDNVLEIQVVLPDGRIATCTETETVIEKLDKTKKTLNNGDLFWALRGGGGGTFGVVVYYVFKLHPAPSSMVVLNTYIPLKIDTFGIDLTRGAMEVIRSFSNLPSEWGGYFLFNNAPATLSKNDTGLDFDLETRGSMTLHINKFGPRDGTEEETLKTFVDFCTANDIPYNLTDFSSFLEYAKVAYDPPIVRTYLATTLLQPEKQGTDFADFINTEFFETFLKNSVYLGCTGVMLGGHVKDFGADSTPLHPGYRTASAALSCGVALGDISKPLMEQAMYDDILIPMTDKFSRGLNKFGSGMYFNEPTKNNPNWRDDFWGGHYERLLKIKRLYDSDNYFTCHHCVGSEFPSKWSTADETSDAPRHAGTYLSLVLSIFIAINIL